MEMEEGYRRGAALGLTIAEIFILLVFLMLLAPMGVNHFLGPWRPIMENYTPEEIERAFEDPDSLRIEIEKLREEKKALQVRIKRLEGEGGPTAEIERVKRTLEACNEALAAANRVIKKQQVIIDSLYDETRIFGKGITPPCWYQRIEETNPITRANWREKPYYLFDIAIREDHMEVQRLPIPAGSAEDDDGLPYAQEAESLSLDAIPYGTPLSDAELRTVMTPLYERAKASQVRTYSCIFYVRVWDETPSGAKDRWKQAHDGVLEQLFGTHQVRGTSWEDRGHEPVNVRVKMTWQGLEIAPENRCSEFNREQDYPYSQALERQILEHLGVVRCSYTGRIFDTLLETEIEHIVALSEAHDSGLCGADAEIRRQFSGDLLNLTLADPLVNREKSDKDAAEWLPKTNRQWYAQKVIDVKRKYGLTIDKEEHEALRDVLIGLETAEDRTVSENAMARE